MKYSLFLIIFLISCSNAAKTPPSYNTMDCNVLDPITGENISCGIVPITLNKKLVNQFKTNCNIENKIVEPEFSNEDISCYKNNLNNVANKFYYGLYVYNKEGESNKKEWLEIIGSAAESKYPPAVFFMNKYYRVNGDDTRAFQVLFDARSSESPMIDYLLGSYYVKGIGVEENPIEAAKWLHKSKQYMPAAYRDLAVISLNDNDDKKFLEYSQIALDKGFFLTNFNLMWYYMGELNSESVKDMNKAKIYIDNLIKINHPSGYFGYAKWIELGGKMDYINQVCQLYGKASEMGYSGAELNASTALYNGKYCTKNDKVSYEILLFIYKNTGDEEIKVMATHNLGYYYINGIGVNKDKEIAMKYLIESAKKGYEPSIDLINEITVFK